MRVCLQGPGGIAGAFVHARHAQLRPALAGWWGQDASVRFQMLAEHQPRAGAQGFQLSNPAVLPTVCLLASLELFDAAGMRALRAKSEALTAYLELLLHRRINAGGQQRVRILTPRDPAQRGCQLSLSFALPVGAVHAALERAGVVCDIRRPSVMRIAPAPLYNSFADVRRFVALLERALADEAVAAQ
jgi:kynureninase